MSTPLVTCPNVNLQAAAHADLDGISLRLGRSLLDQILVRGPRGRHGREAPADFPKRERCVLRSPAWASVHSGLITPHAATALRARRLQCATSRLPGSGSLLVDACGADPIERDQRRGETIDRLRGSCVICMFSACKGNIHQIRSLVRSVESLGEIAQQFRSLRPSTLRTCRSHCPHVAPLYEICEILYRSLSSLCHSFPPRPDFPGGVAHARPGRGAGARSAGSRRLS